MLLERDGLSVSEFRVQALACGHRGLTSLADEMQKDRQAEASLVEEGI
jgi:PTS system N-acetylgalactosamine-specific IIA component